MRIEIQKCILDPYTGEWLLFPEWVVVNSPAELQAALKTFAKEVQQYEEHLGQSGGDYGQI